MRFLYENLAVIYIAIVTSLMAWLYGGMQQESLLATVPWLMLFMAELLFFFPQRRGGETTYEARERVWREMKKDPLVWTALGLVVLLAVPFINSGLCPNCDRELIAQGLKADPPATFLPFCVDIPNHLNVFFWFVVSMSCMIATRHCLVGNGKRRLLEMIVWNGVALAILGFVQIAAKAPGPLWKKPDMPWPVPCFSTWGYVNAAGDYFTTLFCVSVGLWRWRYDEAREVFSSSNGVRAPKPRDLFWRQNVYLVPAALFFFATANTSSRASIMLVTAMATLFFVHTFVSFVARIGKVARVKATAIAGLVFGAMAFCVVNFMPASASKEMKTVDSTAVLERITGKSEAHVSLATALWKDHFLFGCGGWGYKHLCVTKMTDKLKVDGPGAANVHNDYMQFLAEHGAVGFGVIVAIVVMLLRPLVQKWRILVKTARFSLSGKKVPHPVQIFALPAPVFCLLMALVATLIHAFGDCVFRSLAVMSLFFVVLAALDGFMPDVEIGTKDDQPATEPIHHQHHHHHHHATR